MCSCSTLTQKTHTTPLHKVSRKISRSHSYEWKRRQGLQQRRTVYITIPCSSSTPRAMTGNDSWSLLDSCSSNIADLHQPNQTDPQPQAHSRSSGKGASPEHARPVANGTQGMLSSDALLTTRWPLLLSRSHLTQHQDLNRMQNVHCTITSSTFSVAWVCPWLAFSVRLKQSQV